MTTIADTKEGDRILVVEPTAPKALVGIVLLVGDRDERGSTRVSAERIIYFLSPAIRVEIVT
jgi:hypothetical protein